jgi:DNA-binding protein HU-beta
MVRVFEKCGHDVCFKNSIFSEMFVFVNRKKATHINTHVFLGKTQKYACLCYTHHHKKPLAQKKVLGILLFKNHASRVPLFIHLVFNAMNKADLVEKIHGVLDCTKADAERVMETVIESIASTLKKGGEVSIAGLGIFSTKVRPARTGRNPRTGESIEIDAVRVPKFRPAKGLKDAVK